MKHGKTCHKVAHVREGSLHGEDYDGPYDVDGMAYCGRCHFGIEPGDELELAEPAKLDDGGPMSECSLRDWFAGQALTGLLVAGKPIENREVLVEAAYKLADAMLARRKQT